MPLSPEERARQNIDGMLNAAGWIVQNRSDANIDAGPGVAIREFSLACEGRLVPTEVELARKEGRDYEPADELLERILRERRARWEAESLAKMIESGKRPTDDRWKDRYKEPGAPDTRHLPIMPEGWTVALSNSRVSPNLFVTES